MRQWIAAALLVACVAAGPASKPAAPAGRAPASQPATVPARVDPAFVADFNAHLIDAKFDEVLAKLRAMGAVGQEPRVSEFKKGKDVNVSLGYTWEFSTYSFNVDEAGKIRKFRFDAVLDGAGSGGGARGTDILKPGNKWYATHRWPQSVPGWFDGRVAFQRVQAASPAEAAAKMVEACRKADVATAKMSGKPSPLPAVKVEDVEVHEWSMPRLTRAIGERTD